MRSTVVGLNGWRRKKGPAVMPALSILKSAIKNSALYPAAAMGKLRKVQKAFTRP